MTHAHAVQLMPLVATLSAVGMGASLAALYLLTRPLWCWLASKL